MTVYQGTPVIERPPTAQHEAAQRFDVLATDLNLYSTVDANQVTLSQETGRWNVTIGSTEATVTRPAPQGLLIREHDRASGHIAYAYIDAAGNRRFLSVGGDADAYPIEVAGRLMEVRDHRHANRLDYNDPLGLVVPEAYQPYWNGDYGDYNGRHVNTARGPSISERLKNSRLGRMVVGLFSRSTAQPAEQPQTLEAPVDAPFQPVMVAGEPLPRRAAAASTTTTAETEPAPAAPATSRLTRVAEGLGLVTSSVQTEARPTPASTQTPSPRHAAEMTPQERQRLTIESVLFDIGQVLGMNGDRLPSIDTLRGRGDAPAAVRTVLANYRRRAGNGDASATTQMTALIEFMPLIHRS